MKTLENIKALTEEMTEWRHHLHRNPELSEHESKTAAFIMSKLAPWDIPFTTLGRHGVVATLKGKTDSGRAIMLRADTDALPIQEENDVPWKSKYPGVMHACGHDGHTAMLLGAAKYLKEHNDFDGTVHFLFQPAEETGTGAADMIKAGLFKKFPVEAVYGLHNAPMAPLGIMGTRTGNFLAGESTFNVTFTGHSGHASEPEKSTDIIGAAIAAVQKLKADFTRERAPDDAQSLLVVTTLETSSKASNVLPAAFNISGTMRSFDRNTILRMQSFIEKTVVAAARKVGASVNVAFSNGFPPLDNNAKESAIAVEAARQVPGVLKVFSKAPQKMGTEDFAYLLEKKDGNYMALGTGPWWSAVRESGIEGLHSPRFDFNDAALPIGASYWVALTQQKLPLKTPKP